MAAKVEIGRAGLIRLTVPAMLLAAVGSASIASAALERAPGLGLRDALIGMPAALLMGIGALLAAVIYQAIRMGVMNQQARAMAPEKARLSDFVLTASDLFWEMGPDFRFTWVSDPTVARAWLGKTLMDLGAEAGTDPVWQRLREDLAHKREFRAFDCPFVNGPLGLRKLRLSGVPIRAKDGSFAGYRGSACDMSEEDAARAQVARMERLLADAIAQVDQGFVLFDREGRLVLANEVYRSAYPLVADLLVPGATFEGILDAAAERGGFAGEGDKRAWVEARLWRHLAHDGPVDCELADGRWWRVSERATADGGVVKMLTDITELVHARDSRSAIEDSLVEARRFETVARLAAGLTVEMDELAVGIEVANKRRTLATISPAGAEAAAVQIADCAGRLRRLVQALGRFAQTHGAVPQRVEIAAAARDVVARGGRVTLDDEALDPAFARVDPLLLQLGLDALIAQAGDSVVALKTRVQRSGRAHNVALEVVDNGPGMDPDAVPNLFEPSPDGSLGLLPAFTMVHQAGGTIDVETAPGQGTRIRLVLPLAA
ncbi:PAS-domain containing protein [Zavarzinia sp. CC-PAN008]|uniref:PAS-domain containing protein n=1 Tax=Zavarzinia sp. CC-PAN008 TaxID=3243332 RepID=UPI003F745963